RAHRLRPAGRPRRPGHGRHAGARIADRLAVARHGLGRRAGHGAAQRHEPGHGRALRRRCSGDPRERHPRGEDLMDVVVRVIPCLDVAAGRVVKGVNFEGLRDAGDPVELAAKYYEQGADEITFLDVTATVEDRATTYETVTATAEQV